VDDVAIALELFRSVESPQVNWTGGGIDLAPGDGGSVSELRILVREGEIRDRPWATSAMSGAKGLLALCTRARGEQTRCSSDGSLSRHPVFKAGVGWVGVGPVGQTAPARARSGI
jgi:hypothetical protein